MRSTCFKKAGPAVRMFEVQLSPYFATLFSWQLWQFPLFFKFQIWVTKSYKSLPAQNYDHPLKIIHFFLPFFHAWDAFKSYFLALFHSTKDQIHSVDEKWSFGIILWHQETRLYRKHKVLGQPRYITESPNNYIWKGSLEAIWSDPLLKQGHPELAGQDHI